MAKKEEVIKAKEPVETPVKVDKVEVSTEQQIAVILERELKVSRKAQKEISQNKTFRFALKDDGETKPEDQAAFLVDWANEKVKTRDLVLAGFDITDTNDMSPEDRRYFDAPEGSKLLVLEHE